MIYTMATTNKEEEYDETMNYLDQLGVLRGNGEDQFTLKGRIMGMVQNGEGLGGRFKELAEAMEALRPCWLLTDLMSEPKNDMALVNAVVAALNKPNAERPTPEEEAVSEVITALNGGKTPESSQNASEVPSVAEKTPSSSIPSKIELEKYKETMKQIIDAAKTSGMGDLWNVAEWISLMKENYDHACHTRNQLRTKNAALEDVITRASSRISLMLVGRDRNPLDLTTAVDSIVAAFKARLEEKSSLEEINAMQAKEIARLSGILSDHGPEGRNVRNGDFAALMEENDRLAKLIPSEPESVPDENSKVSEVKHTKSRFVQLISMTDFMHLPETHRKIAWEAGDHCPSCGKLGHSRAEVKLLKFCPDCSVKWVPGNGYFKIMTDPFEEAPAPRKKVMNLCQEIPIPDKLETEAIETFCLLADGIGANRRLSPTIDQINLKEIATAVLKKLQEQQKVIAELTGSSYKPIPDNAILSGYLKLEAEAIDAFCKLADVLKLNRPKSPNIHQTDLPSVTTQIIEFINLLVTQISALKKEDKPKSHEEAGRILTDRVNLLKQKWGFTDEQVKDITEQMVGQAMTVTMLLQQEMTLWMTRNHPFPNKAASAIADLVERKADPSKLKHMKIEYAQCEVSPNAAPMDAGSATQGGDVPTQLPAPIFGFKEPTGDPTNIVLFDKDDKPLYPQQVRGAQSDGAILDDFDLIKPKVSVVEIDRTVASEPDFLKEWERWVSDTATYFDCGNGDITYPLLGLVGELGELVNSIVKYYRKSDLITLKIQDLPPALRKKLKDESYDALHFLMFLLNEQGISLAELIAYGREKLEKRMEEGTVHKENRIDGSLVGRTVNITATVTDKSPITTATRTETFQSVILCEDLYSIKYSLEGPNLVTIVDFISFEVVDKLPGDWHEKIKSLPSTKSGSVLRQTFYSKMI